MSRRILRFSLVPPLVSLFLSTPVVHAAVGFPNCTTLSWAFNSHSQSPCMVAAYMLATCKGGSLTLPPLPLPGDYYGGPTVPGSPDSYNNCLCSTVGYSLMSACASCQGRNAQSWTEFVANCTSALPPSQFPNPVPPDIYVPHWAIIDITKENGWNATESNAAGNSPEFGPGAIFGALGVSTSSAGTPLTNTPSTSTSSAGAPPTAPPKSSHSKSHAGAIAGGVVGGIIGCILLSWLLVWATRYIREQRRIKGLRNSYLEASRPGQSVAGKTEQLMVMSDKDPDEVATNV